MNNKNLFKIMEELMCLIKPLQNEKLNVLGKFLLQRIANPESYVVLLGETSSGKSTIINSFIKQKILPVSSIPTTGAITEIYFDQDSKKIGFYAVNKNATMEILDESMFRTLVQTPDKDLSRLRVVVPTEVNSLHGSRLFDTPGYGSIINEPILPTNMPNI